MPTAEQYLAHIQAHGHTVRRGFTRDGQPVRGYSISLDPSNPNMWIQNGYVWPQQAPPYNYVVPVHHCGITLGVFAHELGMQAGRDWFDPAWTPSGAEGFRAAGRWHTRPQRGDWAFFNYGSGMIRHVAAVLNADEFDAGFVTCFEFNVDLSGVGRILRRPTWMIVGYGRPNYSPAPNRPDPTPAIIATTALAALTKGEHDMSIIVEIYRDADLTGDGPIPGAQPIRHEVYRPGRGWAPAIDGNYTEANGYRRERVSESAFAAEGLHAVNAALTMTDLVTDRALSKVNARP